MFKRKGLLVLVIFVLGAGLLLVGCGGSKSDPAKEQAPPEQVTVEPAKEVKTETPVAPQQEKATEEAKAEPKPEEPKPELKPEEPKPEPKVEQPKVDKPAGSAIPNLRPPHVLDGPYASCGTCHAGGAIFSNKPPHGLEGANATCTTCHKLEQK